MTSEDATVDPENAEHVGAANPGTYRATVQYDGTAYQGFQRQRDGTSTVQAAIETALEQISGHPVVVVGAGRTDTGVHALGQVVSFTIDWSPRHGNAALLRAMNANLPRDIVALDVTEAAPGFHPRFSARRRSYRYRIHVSAVPDLFRRDRVWHLVEPLDVVAMDAAAKLLLGEHDFATFGRAPVGENTSRTVFEATCRPQDDEVWFTITANAFLNRMVRSLMGSIKEVGTGKWQLADFRAALEAKSRGRSATAAPPQGLCLVAVEYED